MIPTPPALKYAPGTRVQVVQTVRVGNQVWKTRVVGVVDREGIRPVGGMEMGGKALFSHQSTLRLRKTDGEITVVAIDENTTVDTLPESA